MQYLMSVIEQFLPGGVRADEAGSADATEAAAIDVFNAQLLADGHWIFAGGLAAPNTAVVVDDRDVHEGAASVVEAPLFASTEHYGGFWIIDVADADTARALALGASRACNRKIELRPLLSAPSHDAAAG
ncbi:YciI family protein [Frondihabitans cladoniiphilus]|uniref:YciI family protein n=1 Tax=Frondihabitans cladoniiphilus TaxID=715785 RepID=A0ABP8VN94_9MICO